MGILTKIKPWTPKKLSGCALYLDSSMGITLSSGYVSQWADQSGNGRHASQSTASYRPAYVIDPKKNTWSGALSPSGTPPSARDTFTAVVYGNYMYVFGGFSPSANNDLHRLNLDTLTWSGALSTSGTPPSVRGGHTAIVYGNYMYVFGGWDTSSYYNDLHRLNLDTLTWSGALSPSGTPPSGRWGHTAIVYGNYMYIFGGSDGSNKNDVHRLNLNTLTWSGALSPSGTPPSARFALSAVVYSNYMYIFGGNDGSLKNDLHRLNLDTLTWSDAFSPFGTPPGARSYHVAVTYGNYMYIFGGYTGSSYYNDLHRTDLSTVVSVFKGRPALRFDGSNDYLSMTSTAADIMRNRSAWTIFAVVRRGNDTATSKVILRIDTSTTGLARVILLQGTNTDASKDGVGGRRSDEDSYAESIGSPISTDPSIYSVTMNYGEQSLSLYRNGSVSYSGSNGFSAGSTSDTNSATVSISVSDSRAYIGDILFIAIYNRALSDAERQKVERWLGARYGITVA